MMNISREGKESAPALLRPGDIDNTQTHQEATLWVQGEGSQTSELVAVGSHASNLGKQDLRERWGIFIVFFLAMPSVGWLSGHALLSPLQSEKIRTWLAASEDPFGFLQIAITMALALAVLANQSLKSQDKRARQFQGQGTKVRPLHDRDLRRAKSDEFTSFTWLLALALLGTIVSFLFFVRFYLDPVGPGFVAATFAILVYTALEISRLLTITRAENPINIIETNDKNAVVAARGLAIYKRQITKSSRNWSLALLVSMTVILPTLMVATLAILTSSRTLSAAIPNFLVITCLMALMLTMPSAFGPLILWERPQSAFRRGAILAQALPLLLCSIASGALASAAVSFVMEETDLTTVLVLLFIGFALWYFVWTLLGAMGWGGVGPLKALALSELDTVFAYKILSKDPPERVSARGLLRQVFLILLCLLAGVILPLTTLSVQSPGRCLILAFIIVVLSLMPAFAASVRQRADYWVCGIISLVLPLLMILIWALMWKQDGFMWQYLVGVLACTGLAIGVGKIWWHPLRKQQPCATSYSPIGNWRNYRRWKSAEGKRNRYAPTSASTEPICQESLPVEETQPTSTPRPNNPNRPSGALIAIVVGTVGILTGALLQNAARTHVSMTSPRSGNEPGV
ncbi:MAG: hypothetical protein LBN10_00555 [Propionibacteriaceae bacterium]|jgi:hypothetical protein|nr:hypothetical protein [Propionibacteriaceae bacterium]